LKSLMGRVIFHVDMDSFFASVEKRKNPALEGLPVIIGADPKGGKGRGVVSTCSYEARKFGVHSAQPISKAYKLCPHAVFLPVNMELYQKVSERVMALLRSFSDRFEQVSIDEAFLDVSEKVKQYTSPQQLAERIKDEIRRKEGLSCSIGVAPNKSAAKIASSLRKPDGLTVVNPEKVKEFLNPLPASKISGVGRKMQERLASLGIKTIGQLARQPLDKLTEHFGRWGLRLWEVANGLEEDEVEDSYPIKSLGTEHTFEEDVGDWAVVEDCLNSLVEKVHRRVLEEGFLFRTVGVKIRFEDFETFTRSKSRQIPTNQKEVLHEYAELLLKEFKDDSRKLRLIGVKVSNLQKVGKTRNLLEWSR